MIVPDEMIYKGAGFHGFVLDYFFHKGGMISFTRAITAQIIHVAAVYHQVLVPSTTGDYNPVIVNNLITQNTPGIFINRSFPTVKADFFQWISKWLHIGL